jgi:hypothetical protein
MNERGAFQWFSDNADGLAIAMAAAFGAATLSTMLQQSGLRMLLLGLLAAFMFTGMAVPIGAIYFNLHWAWWGPIGGFIGLTWSAIAWFAIRFTNRLARRAPDFADALPVTVITGGLDLGRRTLPASTDNQGGNG